VYVTLRVSLPGVRAEAGTTKVASPPLSVTAGEEYVAIVSATEPVGKDDPATPTTATLTCSVCPDVTVPEAGVTITVGADVVTVMICGDTGAGCGVPTLFTASE